MAPVRFTDVITDDEIEDDESQPWDPFWEFVMGGDHKKTQQKQRGRLWGSQPEHSGDANVDNRNSRASSSRTSAFGDRRDDEDDDNGSYLSFLNKPYVVEYDEKEEKRKKRQAAKRAAREAKEAKRKSKEREVVPPRKSNGILGFRGQKKHDDNVPWSASFSSFGSLDEAEKSKPQSSRKGNGILGFRGSNKKKEEDNASWAPSFSSFGSFEDHEKSKSQQQPRRSRFGIRSKSNSTKKLVSTTGATSERKSKTQPTTKQRQVRSASQQQSQPQRQPQQQEQQQQRDDQEHVIERKRKEYARQRTERDSVTGQSQFGLITLDDIADTFEPWIRPSSSEETESLYEEESSAMTSTEEESASLNAITEDELSTEPERQQVETNEVLLKYDPTESFDDSLLAHEDLGTQQNRIKETFKPMENTDRDFQEIQKLPPAADFYANHGMATSPTGVGRVVCYSVKNHKDWKERTGNSIHELSREELAEIFPKLRSISEEGFMSHPRSQIIGNSNSFEKDMPAHVQVMFGDGGPKSLYEYEYDRGSHEVVMYSRFGDDPKALLKIHKARQPPQPVGEGLMDFNRVLVQVEASTVSQTDCVIRSGKWRGRGMIPLPNSPGVDMVGKLYRIDTESSRKYGLNTGDRVISLTKWGGNARYLALKPDHLVKVPEFIDPAEAACLPETYLTAFQVLHVGQRHALRYRVNSLKGKSFLLIGTVSTNMGRAISQLAAVGGGESIYATTTHKNYDKLTHMGILPLSHDPLDWHERLRGRIDVAVSFDADISPLHYKLLSEQGEIVVVTRREVDIVTTENSTAKGSSVASKLVCRRTAAHLQSRTHTYDVYAEWEDNLELCKNDLQHLVNLLEEGKVEPHILERIPLTKVARAQELMGVKRVPGFIVCEPWLVTKSRAVCL